MRLSGNVGPKTESKLILEDFPLHNLKNLAMMPGRTRELQTFRGAAVAGHQDDVHKLTMTRMDAGDASLVVESRSFKLEGRIVEVRRAPRFP